MSEPISTTQLVAHGGIALFGAIVHAAQAHRKGQSKTLLDFMMLTAMSSFSGVMFALIGFHFFEGELYVTMALAGTGGFLGVEGMSIIVERVTYILNNKK